MVDLPQIPNVVPEVRAPQSRVSPSDIAQPYMEFAQNLDKAGEALSKSVAEPLARQAGFSAVTRDGQGNITVDRPPVIGDAAIAFSRAAKFSALAEAEAEAKREDLKLSKQFHNDPDGYLRASEEFRGAVVKKWTDAAGPEVGMTLGRSVDAASTYNYRWLLLEQQRTIKHDFDRNTQAGKASADEDIVNLIQAGGLDSPEGRKEFDRLMNKRLVLAHERVSNPVLMAPKDVEAFELKHLDERVGAAKFANTIGNILNDEKAGGVQVAQQVVESAAKDNSVSPTQRMMNYVVGQKAIQDFQNNIVKAAHINATIQKQTDDQFENAVIADRASDVPKITENDIKTNKDASPQAKMRMLAWVKRDGMPEPLAHVSQAATVDLMRRMNLPEGDPGKITSLAPIHEAYAPVDGGPGSITQKDHDWLQKQFTDSRTPDGETLQTDRKLFMGNFARLVDGDYNFQQGQHSLLGTQRAYEFNKEAQRRENELRSKGLDPHLVYDPKSQYYFGTPENLAKYRTSLQEAQKYEKSLKEADKARDDGKVPTIRTKEEFDRLPRGGEYIRDGKRYRKP